MSRFAPPFPARLVVVDLDGTLIHTAPDLADCANLMLRDLGLPARDEATVASWIGNGVSRLVKRALTGSLDGEPDAQLFARAYPLFLEHYGRHVARKSRPFPGVREGLDALTRAGIVLACITNKAERFTLPLLEALQLRAPFALVLSGDSLPKRKPDPLPLLHACAHFDVAPAQALLVGDSHNDTQAARAAGMPVVCVTYGYNRGVDVRTLEPDAVIDSLAELPPLLQRDAAPPKAQSRAR